MQATTRTQYVHIKETRLACRGWGPGMVPFTENLLQACRKLAIKLEDSMRFKGRVFLSEIGSPEHDYSHLLRLFGERLHVGITLLCMYCPHVTPLADNSQQLHIHLYSADLQMCLYVRGAAECVCCHCYPRTRRS